MLKNKTLIVICVISGLLFLFSCVKAIDICLSASREKHAFDELAELVEKTQKDASIPVESQTMDTADVFSEESAEISAEASEELETSVKTILPEYAVLYEQNSDFFAWICIEDTVVNYPVMNTPEDMQYYLTRAFDKSNSVSGTPFIDSDCSDEGGIYIVYGHYMSNGSMFGILTDYEDPDFWEEHKTIHFDTLYEHGSYEVLAVFRSRIYKPEDKGFRYYEYTDLSSEVQFNSFLEQVKEAELYDTGISAEYGDTLLVLSTCNYYTDNGRFVVVARKK